MQVEGTPRWPYRPGQGRGVVTCAGGSLYLSCAWVMIRTLRHLGCTLPVELWHLGPAEIDPHLSNLFEGEGVRLVDALQVDIKPYPRRLNGWELKPFSILCSSFEEVLFLDADNIPVRDPTFLFDTWHYQEHHAVFWPDLPPQKRKEWIPAAAWQSVGLEPVNCPAFESGQILVHREKCHAALSLTMFLNEHSDHYYQMVYGDKDTFLLAFKRTPGQGFAMPRAARWMTPAIQQHDMSGRLLFQHVCQGKDKLARGELIPSLHNAPQVQDAARMLQRQWHGSIWAWRDQNQEEHRLARVIPGRYVYARAGQGERILQLLPGGLIGEGAADCERRWTLRQLAGMGPNWPELALIITGSAHKGTEIGMMFLRQDDKGIWRGRWQAHERNEVSLTPWIDPEPAYFWRRPWTHDEGIFDAVYRHNEYDLPAAFSPDDVIIDIGAHIGSFALACLARGASKIICLEPAADNYHILRGNLSGFGERVVLQHRACWRSDCYEEPLFCQPDPTGSNTGAWTCLGGKGKPAEDTLGLDVLLSILPRPIRLLKLDCEGAEFPILLTARSLDSVNAIVGEYHEGFQPPGLLRSLGVERFTVDLLRQRLEGQGFTVTIEPGEGLGKFFARRV